MTIGIFGVDFTATNLGCSALAYSFFDLLTNRICDKENTEFIIFTVISDKDIKGIPENIKYKNVKYSPRSLKSNSYVTKEIKKCDVVVDFTSGDSFADIYGLKRFVAVSISKVKAIIYRKNLILGPQTYGPIKSSPATALFKYIIRHSYRVYSRDNESAEYVNRISGRRPQTFIDVAFALDYKDMYSESPEGKRRIGVNVSGLLWSGGYTGDNQFGLTVDYKEYIDKLMAHLTGDDRNEVYLIPHVLTDNYDDADNDVKAIEEIAEKYGKCIVAPRFESPMEAKSFISSMDVFTGARMHSTIAAMSAGVAVIPFSYSRKFEGLFETLGYKYCVGGCSLSTEEALNKTIEYIENYKTLKENVQSGRKLANERIDRFVEEISSAIADVKTGKKDRSK